MYVYIYIYIYICYLQGDVKLKQKQKTKIEKKRKQDRRLEKVLEIKFKEKRLGSYEELNITNNYGINRSSHLKVFLVKQVLKICSK